MRQFLLLEQFFAKNPELTEKHGYARDKIIKLVKLLYGLKQAGNAWQKKVRELLARRGFEPLVSDDAVYVNRKTGVIVASYIDDFLLFGPNEKALKDLAFNNPNNVLLKDPKNAD